MSVTCPHKSPWCQLFLLKICWRQMLPMSWLDSWLGHMSADVSPHDCPAISIIHRAITLMGVMVTFDGKKYFICLSMHKLSFLLHSCTKLHHYGAIFCKALLFFLHVQKNQLTCWQNLGWCPANMSFGRLGQNYFAECWANIFDILPTWWCMSGQHVNWGVLATQHNTNISN